MYAPTSTISPRSGPTSGETGDGLTDFDGAAEILRAWSNGLRPDPDLTVSQWADRHRMLSGRASAEPGRYRTAPTPYMREIMDRLSPGDTMQRVVFQKAAQVGATEAGNNWIGFAIHQAPGPMLAVQPIVELAKRNSRQRIDPLIDESPELRDRVKPARSRDALCHQGRRARRFRPVTQSLSSADPDRVIAAARSWLGTPYHDQASLRGVGCDCLGLVRGVWREVVGPEPFPIPPYSRDWGETGPREILAEGARRMMPEIACSDAGPGALVLFRMKPRAIAKHVGVLTGPGAFLHAYERLGVIEEPLTSSWRRRIAFAFLFPQR